MQVVWFKRDLRILDHAPLAEAARRGPVLPLFIYEPELWNGPDYDPRHWAFARQCLEELDGNLRRLGAPLVVRCGDAVEVLRSLPVTAVYAHEETGNGWTYARDRRVRRWARDSGIPFFEFPSNGVVRGLRSRDGWSRRWKERMSGPIIEPPARLLPHGVDPGGLPPDHCAIEVQKGGERAAHELLDSFLARRGERYHLEMSSPLTAEEGCSRLSPHLAWGTISSRVVFQAVERRRQTAQGTWRMALAAFVARLHWRDHFIQKLEDEPRIEFENFVRAYDGLRENEFNDEWFDRWREGRTGYPFVDACMRMLRQTGWLNFRMRAMLVSFAAYDLWLHWRPVALHLARLFTDYEPGIHYSQCQMQSGTTGINTLRVYNPGKQWRDQDPASEFVRRWVPEFDDPQRYPAPIVDHREAARRAQARIRALRRTLEARTEAEQVRQRHGSRKRPSRRRRA
ncbi:MAG: deoxyribodipyrimidine photo-lyase [Bryobacteraceae bacterium]|nr:deoxyribodipyrimidine photo-lyase [Bryobacteraceae bacterium]